MKIINPFAIAECRSIGFCEHCGHGDVLQIHHLMAKGHGGAKRVDVAFNLICLCLDCHNKAHAGNITFDKLAGIILKREIWKLQRAVKPRAE